MYYDLTGACQTSLKTTITEPLICNKSISLSPHDGPQYCVYFHIYIFNFIYYFCLFSALKYYISLIQPNRLVYCLLCAFPLILNGDKQCNHWFSFGAPKASFAKPHHLSMLCPDHKTVCVCRARKMFVVLMH